MNSYPCRLEKLASLGPSMAHKLQACLLDTVEQLWRETLSAWHQRFERAHKSQADIALGGWRVLARPALSCPHALRKGQRLAMCLSPEAEAVV